MFGKNIERQGPRHSRTLVFLSPSDQSKKINQVDEHRTQDLCPALIEQTIHLKLGRCFYPNLILRTAGHRPFMPSVLRIHPATPLSSHLDPAILDFLNLIKKSPVRLLRQTGIHSIRAPLTSQLDRGSHVDRLTGISHSCLVQSRKGLLRLHRPGEFQKVGGNEDIRFQAIDGVAKATTPSCGPPRSLTIVR